METTKTLVELLAEKDARAQDGFGHPPVKGQRFPSRPAMASAYCTAGRLLPGVMHT